MNQEQRNAGFIALTSAIVISALLLCITVSLGLSGFFTRTNIFDSESKEHSLALAEACANKALLNLAQGSTYTGPVAVDNDACTIVSIQASSGNVTVKTQGVFNKAYTNLEAVANGSSLDIVSWREVP